MAREVDRADQAAAPVAMRRQGSALNNLGRTQASAQQTFAPPQLVLDVVLAAAKDEGALMSAKRRSADAAIAVSDRDRHAAKLLAAFPALLRFR